MNKYLYILAAVLSLVLVILSGVSLGSVNKMDETKTPSKDDITNAKRSSTGLLVISIALFVVSGALTYSEFAPKRQSIYYF